MLMAPRLGQVASGSESANSFNANHSHIGQQVGSQVIYGDVNFVQSGTGSSQDMARARTSTDCPQNMLVYLTFVLTTPKSPREPSKLEKVYSCRTAAAGYFEMEHSTAGGVGKILTHYGSAVTREKARQ